VPKDWRRNKKTGRKENIMMRRRKWKAEYDDDDNDIDHDDVDNLDQKDEGK